MFGAGRHAELPQLFIQLFIKVFHHRADHAEIVLLQFLAFGRRGTEQRAAGQHKVKPFFVILFADQEKLLFGADRRIHTVHFLAEKFEHPAGLVADRLHRTQQRGLFIQRFTGIGAERRRNAEHFVFDKGVARRVPGGVAAGFGGGAQPAGGEARSVGLALDELFARKFHDGGTVRLRAHKAVVLFTGDAVQRLEPVGVVGGAFFDGPALHDAGHDIGDIQIKRLAFFDRGLQALVG